MQASSPLNQEAAQITIRLTLIWSYMAAAVYVLVGLTITYLAHPEELPLAIAQRCSPLFAGRARALTAAPQIYSTSSARRLRLLIITQARHNRGQRPLRALLQP